MGAIRVINCPACGRRHLIGSPCAIEEQPKPGRALRQRLRRLVLSLVVITLSAEGLTAAALAAAELWGRGWAIAIVLFAYIVMLLCRLGYDLEDNIDLMQLFLPAPFDWSVKVERLVYFWTSPRLLFRCVYLGTVAATVIIVIIFARD